MERKALGLKLLELRQEHQLTQKQLCEALMIGRSTYSYFETGTRTPDLDTLLLISQFYHVSIEDLLSTGPQRGPAQQKPLPDSDVSITHHLKSKHISIDDILSLSKADFDFLRQYQKLTPENKAEFRYMIGYKLRMQTKKLPQNTPKQKEEQN